MSEEERDRGFLTQKDRQYLLGKLSYDGVQQERNRRKYIRNRVRNAVIDFNIVFPYLSERDRKQVFEDVSSNQSIELNTTKKGQENTQGTTETAAEEIKKDVFKESDIKEGIINAIALFYLGCKDANLSPERVFEQGIQRADNEVIATVDIEHPEDALDEIARKILAREQLSESELRLVIHRGGEFTSDFNPELDN